MFANLVLADEINRATPKTQLALLEAMQEKTVTAANRTYKLEPPFFVLATQNPLEMEGTYPLPEAQLDRFMFKVMVDYPTVDELIAILDRTTGADTPEASKVADGKQVIALGQLALNTPIARHVSEYVAKLIVATHPDDASAPEIVNSTSAMARIHAAHRHLLSVRRLTRCWKAALTSRLMMWRRWRLRHCVTVCC